MKKRTGIKIGSGMQFLQLVISRTALMALLMAGFEFTVFAQDFYNLDFENPTFVAIPSGYSGSVDPDEALPGWAVFLGGNFAPYVFYDNRFLDSACVSILDTNSAQSFEGEFTVLLQAGFSGYPNRQSASIAQTALIPAWAKTLLFDASPSASAGNFKVSIAGQNQPFSALASYTNYIIYGVDISAFSGQMTEIQFTSLPSPDPYVAVNGVSVDDIRFSSSPMQNQFSYVTNNGTITITKFTGPGGVVVIPDTINGLPVTTLGAAAFYQSYNLTNVTIPDSVTSIGSNAFYYCTGLIDVTIGNNVTSIWDEAFENCTSLAQVTIPANVIGIGASAFSFCTNLDNLTIPDRVTTIGQGAFDSCLNLTNVTIGSGLTTIAEWAFDRCYKLTSVKLPSSITNIGEYAFYGCTNLTYIAIPNSVGRLGVSAFSLCFGLTNATIGAANIGSGAFDHCTSLTDVTISSSVTNIGDSAFDFCTNLTSIQIPKSVNSIGDFAFGGCTSLSAITVDALNSFYSSIDGVLFNKGQTALIEFPGGRTGTYMIPNNVSSIGSSAFSSCILGSVKIPNSVKNIGEQAFMSCLLLTSAIIGNNVTNIADEAFYYCTGLKGVYFGGNAPGLGGNSVFGYDFLAPTTIYYLPGSTGWGSTFGSCPAVLWNPQAQTADGSFGVLNNQFGFNITGSSNLIIVVEASTNLSNPAWIPVGTNTLNTFVGTNGTSYFSDPQWANYPNRFYRFRSP
jgi:hypothetical protein